MQLPEFDMRVAKYDDFKRFHVRYGSGWAGGPFVHFSTGEMIATQQNSWGPDQRKTYKQLNIQVVSTADADCPRLYRVGDSDAIPKSHLDVDGQQILLIDLDLNLATSLDRVRQTDQTDYKLNMPCDLRGYAKVYYPGAGMQPVGPPIFVERPRMFTRDEMAKADALRAACKAWHGLVTSNADYRPNFMRWDLNQPVSVFELTTYDSLEHMTDLFRTRVATSGYDRGKVRETHQFLSTVAS